MGDYITMPWYFFLKNHVYDYKKNRFYPQVATVNLLESLKKCPKLGIGKAEEDDISFTSFIKPTRNVIIRVLCREGDHAVSVCLSSLSANERALFPSTTKTK